MKANRRWLQSAAAVALAAVVCAGPAIAQDWPGKTPIRMIVPYPPAGGTDILARTLNEKLASALGTTIVVDNKGGAAGNLGTDLAAKAPADGYTVLFTLSSHTINPKLYAKLPFDVEKDFSPIAMLWSVPNLLMMRLELLIKTVPELIALAKAQPGKLSFASSGAGTTPHITGELFKQMAVIDLLHVPYKGSAPAHQDLLANQVDMMFDNIPGPLGLMRGGKVRGVAVTSAKRHPAAPEIPTVAEFLPGFEITSWGGVCAPAGVPAAMVEKCSALAKKALESKRVLEAFDKQGATPMWMTPADTAAFRAADEKKFAPVIKASGAKVE